MSREAVGTGVLHGGKIGWDDQRGFTDQLHFMKDGSVVVRVALVTPKALTLKPLADLSIVESSA